VCVQALGAKAHGVDPNAFVAPYSRWPSRVTFRSDPAERRKNCEFEMATIARYNRFALASDSRIAEATDSLLNS